MPTGFARIVALAIAFCWLSVVRAEPKLSGLQTRHGLCDASAAIAVDADRFLVASDEDNILRLYRRDDASGPLDEFDMDAFLRPDLSSKEADIEGATTIGTRSYWITSHGRNKDGKLRPSRYRFWALDLQVKPKQVSLKPFGQPSDRLLGELLKEPRLAKYGLAAASALAPKEPGALNIEGLAATPEKTLLVGLRNPVFEGKAIVVPLLNPAEAVIGKPAKFGDPIELDLGGLGVRGLEYWPEKSCYLVIGGAIEAETTSRVFTWSGAASETPVPLDGLDLSDLNPESIVVYPKNGEKFQLVSDDGTVRVGGVDCKALGDPGLRTFRSVWIEP